MKFVCPPGKVWQPRRRLRRVKQANIVCYPYPGRPHIIYARRYVVPRNRRTPAQIRMRQLLGALSRDWLGLLTPPQRDAWTAYARNHHHRWDALWIDYARQISRCSPHLLTPFHHRLIRWWLLGRRPLSGQQTYVKLNSVLGRIGRPKLLWPPPPLVPFRPNPVQEVRLRWDAVAADINPRPLNPNPNLNPVAADASRGQSDQQSAIKNLPLRLELVLHHHVKCDLLLFGSAPCSAGRSTMRRPVYLGLLPAPKPGVHDITALYLARFRAPGPNQQVFISAGQHRHGWKSVRQDYRTLLPPKPAPLPLPAPNDQFPILNSQSSIGPRRFPSSILHPLSSILVGCGSAALRLGPHPSWTSSLLPPTPHRPLPPCTRGTPFPRAAVACLACPRRQFHRRELWRGT